MCGIFGVMDIFGKLIPGKVVIQALDAMIDRYNGLGGGFAAYGIYPKWKDHYAFHVMYLDEEIRLPVEEHLQKYLEIEKAEKIPTRKIRNEKIRSIPWRYFVAVPERKMEALGFDNEDDYIVHVVMEINNRFRNAKIVSCGKNMGVFKEVGYPHEVAEYYRIDEYKAYLWLGHGRYPTNTPGWGGGAHPFSILDWSVVHNGEISSYGTNKRFLEIYGYKCTMLTDSEVVAYLFDLLVRRHRLPVELACAALAPPFWKQIEKMPPEKAKLYRALRMTYGAALLNGPFSVVVGHSRMMIGLTDRIKLRPMVAAKDETKVYLASEEAAIRAICRDPISVWAPRAGEPVIAKLEAEPEEVA